MAGLAAIADGSRFLGIEWHVWKVVGWAGNIIFFSRFVVQWIVTEKRRQVVIPIAFWWLSLVGTLIMLIYALFHLRDSVMIFAYAFGWIPYIRNLVIHYRHQAARQWCQACDTHVAHQAVYCHQCGVKLEATTETGK